MSVVPKNPLSSPEFRKMRARAGGLATAALHDPREYTLPARAARWVSLFDAVDPDRSLTETERLIRALRLKQSQGAAAAARALARDLRADIHSESGDE